MARCEQISCQGGDGGLRLHIGERVSLTRCQKENRMDMSQFIQVGAWQVRSQKR